MGIQPRLLPHQIGAGQGQATGFGEQHRQGRPRPPHRLQIQRLPHSTLGTVGSEPLDKGRPEVIHRRQRREIQRGISHQEGSNATASAIICAVTAIDSSGSALSR